jgi:WD40 repeat protein
VTSKKGTDEDPGSWAPSGAQEAWGSWADSDEPPPTSELPSGDARYERLGLVGEGGMGRVFVARDAVLGRDIALKVVSSDDLWMRARFAREARVTAMLDHPAIVPVHDAGTTADGRPFYTMRLVRGRSLEDALLSARGPQERWLLLRPLLAACQAVAFAHEQGVIHRDLKPANVMIGEFGETQVLDWGLARTLDEVDLAAPHDPSPEAAHTRLGAVLGTPTFMSPEAARGQPTGPRSDVWSLGAMLYAVLTGEPPYRGSSAEEVLALARRGERLLVSQRCPGVPAELTAIAARALEPDPSQRYPSARALASDLGSYLDGQRVTAYAYTPLDHLRRALWAWRAPLSVACVAAVLFAGTGVAAWSETAAQRNRALQAEREAHLALVEADRTLGALLEGQAISAAEEERRPEAEILAVHALRHGAGPGAWGVLARFGAAQRPRRVATIEAPSGCRWRGIYPRFALCEGEGELLRLDLPDGAVRWRVPLQAQELSVHLEQDQLLVRLSDQEGQVLALDTGAPVRRVALGGGHPFPVSGSAVSGGWVLADGYWHAPVGARPVAADSAGSIALCRAASTVPFAVSPAGDLYAAPCRSEELALGVPGSPPTRLLPLPGAEARGVTALAFTPDGRSVVLTTLTSEVALFDLEQGTLGPWMAAECGRLFQVEAVSSGRVLLGCERGGPLLWNPRTGAALGRLPGPALSRVAFADDRTLWLARGALEQWVLPAQTAVTRLQGEHGLSAVALSPDGRQVATADGGGWIDVRAVDNGEALLHTRWHELVAKDVAWGVDGRSLWAASMDGQGLARFEVSGWARAPLSAVPGAYRRVGVLADGTSWGLTFGSGPQVFDPAGDPHEALVMQGSRFHDGETAADGSVAVLLDATLGVWALWPGDPPRLERLLADTRQRAVAVTPGAGLLATADERQVRVLRPGGEAVMVSSAPDGVTDLAISADGQALAAVDRHGLLHVWSVADGRLRARLRGHDGMASAVAFSRDGSQLVTAGWDGAVQRWDLSVLDRSPEALLAEIEASWGLTLDALLEP